MNPLGRLGCVTLLLLVPQLEAKPPELQHTRSFAPPAPVEAELPNRIRVLVVERHKIPVAHVVWGIRTGAAADPPGMPGAATMLAEMLTSAVESGGQTLEQRLRARGVLLHADVNRDRTWYSIQLPREQLKWSLRTLQRALLKPKFSEVSLSRARQQLSSAIPQEQGEPELIRTLAEWRAIYGEGHAYGRPIRGNTASLGVIDLQHLRTFHRDHYRPGNTFLVVSGDVQADELVATLGRSIGRWRAPASPPDSEGRAAPEISPERGITLIDLPGSSQAQISAVSPLDGEVMPLDPSASVMNTLLGGSAGSRLNRSLRGHYAYAYGASSQLELNRLGGFLSAGSVVSVADAPDAVRQLVVEVERMREEPEPEETGRARRYLENSFLASFETNRSIARLLARIETMMAAPSSLPAFLAAIPEIGPQQVALSGRRWVNPEQMTVVVVGDREALEQPLRELGLGPVWVWSVDELWGAKRHAPSPDPGSVPTRAEPGEW